MDFYLALAAAVLSLVSLVLHKVKAKTATTLDDKAAEVVDTIRDAIPTKTV
jgi:heme exporter protein D